MSARSIDSALAPRLIECVRRWPAPAARAARAYLWDPPSGPPRRNPRGPRQYWLLLPCWLHARATAGRGRGPGTRGLHDVLWGQYCLFLFVRIHDDLFDGEAQSPVLIYAADLLLLESERAFARHLDERFAKVARGHLATTVRGILEVDALQRRRHGMPPRSAKAYARVSSIFKVGTAAVAEAKGLQRYLTALSRFADELAIADQLLDDLADLDEDLRRGRLNYVASMLLRQCPGPLRSRHDLVRRLTDATSVGPGLMPLVAELRRRLRKAGAIITPLALPEALPYLARLEASIDCLEEGLHRARVARLFGPFLRRQAGHLSPAQERRPGTAPNATRIGRGMVGSER